MPAGIFLSKIKPATAGFPLNLLLSPFSFFHFSPPPPFILSKNIGAFVYQKSKKKT